MSSLHCLVYLRRDTRVDQDVFDFILLRDIYNSTIPHHWMGCPRLHIDKQPHSFLLDGVCLHAGRDVLESGPPFEHGKMHGHTSSWLR